MAAKYSDEEIEAFVKEPKPLPPNYRENIKLRDRRGHKESELLIDGENGSEFHVIFRQNNVNTLDFSIILALLPADTNQLFRLRRYNGKSHEHSNKIEKDKFYDFHVHQATERYQEYGTREDAYAEPRQNYNDFHSALDCLVKECGFILPPGQQRSLFEVENDN